MYSIAAIGCEIQAIIGQFGFRIIYRGVRDVFNVADIGSVRIGIVCFIAVSVDTVGAAGYVGNLFAAAIDAAGCDRRTVSDGQATACKGRIANCYAVIVNNGIASGYRTGRA